MKKAAVATMALLLISTVVSTVALAAPGGPPPGRGMPASRRIHVNPGARTHTPVQNRVRMTPVHSVSWPAGGRMSSYRSMPVSGRVIVRPSLPPPPPVRWRRSGYYSGHYWRPYDYGTVVIGYPVGYYGYPYYGYGPAVRISVRL
jgi:hypothetical protein